MLKILLLRFYTSIKVNGFIKTFFLIPKKIIQQKKIFNIQRSIKISRLIYEYKQLPITIKKIGGYPIDLNLIKKNLNKKLISNRKLIGLTFGIYDDVSFELGLKKLGFKVYSYDPSPVSIKLFKDNHELSKKIFYKPVGLWVYDGSVKFYESDPKDLQSPDAKEYSIVNISNSNQFIEFKCKQLDTIINEKNLTRIDYLKLDIEGAVPSILNKYFNKKKIILPKQICFELEFPEKVGTVKFNKMTNEARLLLKKMKRYYEIFYLPKKDMFSHIIIYSRIKNNIINT